MKDYMTYKGYKGSVSYDDDGGILYGEILNVPDINTYEGKSIKSLKKDFHNAVKDQIWIEKRRKAGKFYKIAP